jgi:hypothetical protein
MFGLIRTADKGSAVIARAEEVDGKLQLSFETQTHGAEIPLPAYVTTSALEFAEEFEAELESDTTENEQIIRLVFPAYGLSDIANLSSLPAAS